jgi:hypothetical protein
MCPNCRQDADLEAPVDVESETWEAILRTSDPLTPTADPGLSGDPQVKMLSFHPMPEISPSKATNQRDSLSNNMYALNLGDCNDDRTQGASPERDLALMRTLSPGLSPIVENELDRPRNPRDASRLVTPPRGIGKRVRALSATRNGYGGLVSLSTTPTIDRGPFVYGDMTVNADGSAEATSSDGNVVRLPRDSVPEDARKSAC